MVVPNDDTPICSKNQFLDSAHSERSRDESLYLSSNFFFTILTTRVSLPWKFQTRKTKRIRNTSITYEHVIICNLLKSGKLDAVRSLFDTDRSNILALIATCLNCKIHNNYSTLKDLCVTEGVANHQKRVEDWSSTSGICEKPVCNNGKA